MSDHYRSLRLSILRIHDNVISYGSHACKVGHVSIQSIEEIGTSSRKDAYRELLITWNASLRFSSKVNIGQHVV